MIAWNYSSSTFIAEWLTFGGQRLHLNFVEEWKLQSGMGLASRLLTVENYVSKNHGQKSHRKVSEWRQIAYLLYDIWKKPMSSELKLMKTKLIQER